MNIIPVEETTTQHLTFQQSAVARRRTRKILRWKPHYLHLLHGHENMHRKSLEKVHLLLSHYLSEIVKQQHGGSAKIFLSSRLKGKY